MDKKNDRQVRRSLKQLDSDIMSSLEQLVAQHGFGKVPLIELCRKAKIQAHVFYRRYDNIDELYNKLALQYDFWINDIIKMADRKTMRAEEFYAQTLKRLFNELSQNDIMQQLLLWELLEYNETTKHTVDLRESLINNFISYYDKLFHKTGVNMKHITYMLIFSGCYLILRNRQLAASEAEGRTNEKSNQFEQTVDELTNVLFFTLNQHSEKIESAKKMLADGIQKDKICHYLGLTQQELAATL